MKITAFNGSPRGERSCSHIMTSEFLAGAREYGAETNNVFLIEKNIGFCRGCFSCWVKTPGRCFQNDDMEALIKEFSSADIVVIATPLYVDNVSGLMKIFLDRLIPLFNPHFDKDNNGECVHKPRYGKFPDFVVMSNSGFPEGVHFQVLTHLFQRMARNTGSRVLAEIYRAGGPLLREKSLLLKPIVAGYKRILRRAGKEITTEGSLSSDTILALAKSLIPERLYIKRANEMWDKLTKKAER